MLIVDKHEYPSVLVSKWYDIGVSTRDIATKLDPSISIPGFLIKTVSWDDPVQTHMNKPPYLVHFWTDL